jgi:hypothetical protein
MRILILISLVRFAPSFLLAGEPAAKQGVESITRADQLARLLEARWTVEAITCFCVSETRFNPSDWNLPAWQGDVWHGFLHISAEPEIGKVYWYALVKNGCADRVSVNVIKNSDHWHLETIWHMSEVFDRLDTKEARRRRIVVALDNAVNAYRWGALPEERGEAEFSAHFGLFRADYPKDSFEYAADGISPTRYTRRAKITFPDTDHEFVAVLDKNAAPQEFMLDGRKDEYMQRLYSTFVTNYSRWLNMLVYGYETASPNTHMPWDDHLEALGVDEASVQHLSEHPLAAGVLPATNGKRRSPAKDVSQPSYEAWKKISKGISETEVFSILGPPQEKDMRHLIGGYTWHYGTVVPKSQVMPEPYEFLVWFLMGRVSGTEDPFDGHFSADSLPTTPILIHPQDGEVFAHYPRFVDLRWYPSSGQYPMRYEIEIDNALAEKATTEPYVSARVSGVTTVRWRVRAVNTKGTSDWSELRTFESKR